MTKLPDEAPEYQQMTVYGFALDSIAQMPVVILKDEDGERTLPIWINAMDALYIAAELIRNDASARTGRNDLLVALLGHLEAEFTEIAITDMKDGLFSSSITMTLHGEEVSLEVRVCEAIVLAMKHQMQVKVARHLLDQVTFPAEGEGKGFTAADERRFVDFLENLDPADLGKYPM